MEFVYRAELRPAAPGQSDFNGMPLKYVIVTDDGEEFDVTSYRDNPGYLAAVERTAAEADERPVLMTVLDDGAVAYFIRGQVWLLSATEADDPECDTLILAAALEREAANTRTLSHAQNVIEQAGLGHRVEHLKNDTPLPPMEPVPYVKSAPVVPTSNVYTPQPMPQRVNNQGFCAGSGTPAPFFNILNTYEVSGEWTCPVCNTTVRGKPDLNYPDLIPNHGGTGDALTGCLLVLGLIVGFVLFIAWLVHSS
ncbi:hypothetical protein [Kineococcus sp. SYSU DK001]|uniref:hypothetical protein n=1 Tax=Kineococcus sp. SYSU DK001 TaxID=3383122 RepID=UPI003D7E694A